MASSGFQIRVNGSVAGVGMAGSFWVDPAALELVRLEVQADKIPPALGIKSTVTRIDYAPMAIGNSTVLLPQAAETLLMLPAGEVRRNDIQFSHCHEYYVESSIRFDRPDTSSVVPVPERRTVDLPAGLTVSIELETAIDSETTHIGDLLRGHVTSDVRHKGRTIIPKGAVATGRVRGLERLRSPVLVVQLTIELAELQWENSIAEFYGQLLPSRAGRGGENALLNLPISDGEVTEIPLSPGEATEAVRAPEIPGTGVLRMTGSSRFHIDAGLRMNWRTLEPNRRRSKSK